MFYDANFFYALLETLGHKRGRSMETFFSEFYYQCKTCDHQSFWKIKTFALFQVQKIVLELKEEVVAMYAENVSVAKIIKIVVDYKSKLLPELVIEPASLLLHYLKFLGGDY
ncbi:hypothetical protein GZ78_17570 [Endozoicomonas numazuensis]|uniref:Uncharacterized protein n=1 Tax=Endozoicomonas numazuensis TaxID=1137799 RepID=A0A081NGI0_9GAMM|nr:hypothetical protein GZ78_17570 [Endozoicomonas numazuensis]